MADIAVTIGAWSNGKSSLTISAKLVGLELCPTQRSLLNVDLTHAFLLPNDLDLIA